MKILSLSLVAVSLILGSASSYAFITSQNVTTCSFSTSITGTNGQSGYACGNYPFPVQVADYYSTSNELQALEQKIVELEKRIKVLEGNPDPKEN